MKFPLKLNLFFLLVIFALSSKGQNPNQKQAILDKIHKLDLRNNKLYVNKYLEQFDDSLMSIPFYIFGEKLVNDYISTNKQLARLEFQYDSLVKQGEKIRTSDSLYKILFKKYMASTYSEKKKLETEFVKHSELLEDENPEYHFLQNRITTKRFEVNIMTIRIILDDFQKRGKLVPTNFLNASNIEEYNQETEIASNLNEISQLRVELKNSELKRPKKVKKA
jgi:hypothetical protein